MSKIFTTGDLHGEIDIHKLNSTNWAIGNTLTKDDYLIVCGDFGLIWDRPEHLSSEEKYWREWLNEKPWTTLFVDGNHENHKRLMTYPVIEKFGGKVHQIEDSIFHLIRGEYYTINEKTFWVMGGATSIDKIYRIPDVTWWEEEIPSYDEMLHGVDTFNEHNNKVDYILSHCAPSDYLNDICLGYQPDEVTQYLNFILHNMEFKKWYCGHYHINKTIDKLNIVYDLIVPLT